MVQVTVTKRRKTIWKYELSVLQDEFRLELPKGALVRHIDMQYENPCLWVEVDITEAQKSVTTYETRRFRIAGTGHVFENIEVVPTDSQSPAKYWCEPQYHEYIGTFQMKGGQFIFHLFEVFTEDLPEDAEIVDGISRQTSD